MRHNTVAVVLLAAVGGCMSMDGGSGPPNRSAGPPSCPGCYGKTNGPPPIPGVQGSWGQQMSMAYPYASSPPTSQAQAAAMMNQSVPLDYVQMSALGLAGSPSGIVQTAYNPTCGPGGCPPGGGMPDPFPPPGGFLTPPGVPYVPGGAPPGGPMMGPGGNPMFGQGPGMPPGMGQGFPGMGQMPPGMGQIPLPPGMGQMPPGMGQMPLPPGMGQMPPGMGQMPLPPGMGQMPPGMGQMPISAPDGAAGMPPGMMGPGGPMPPGVGPAAMAGPGIPPGAVAAVGAMAGGGQVRFPSQRTQVRFTRPSGMKVSWFTVNSDGKPGYSENPIEVPGRYNFMQCAIYRLKLTNIEGQPGLEVYPTLEVVPSNPRTEAFLAHSAVPLEFSEADFKQITAGNYVVKVIYLPNPQYQDQAAIGLGEIVSTQLQPGEDPIAEAVRRGDILLIIRMGNMDQEAPNTPPIGAPPAGHGGAGLVQGMPGMGMMMPGPGPGMMAGPPGAPGRMVPEMMPGGQMASPFMPPQGMMGQGGPFMPPGGGMMGPSGPFMPPGGGIMGPSGPVMVPPARPASAPVMGTPAANPPTAPAAGPNLNNISLLPAPTPAPGPRLPDFLPTSGRSGS